MLFVSYRDKTTNKQICGHFQFQIDGPFRLWESIKITRLFSYNINE